MRTSVIITSFGTFDFWIELLEKNQCDSGTKLHQIAQKPHPSSLSPCFNFALQRGTACIRQCEVLTHKETHCLRVSLMHLLWNIFIVKDFTLYVVTFQILLSLLLSNVGIYLFWKYFWVVCKARLQALFYETQPK